MVKLIRNFLRWIGMSDYSSMLMVFTMDESDEKIVFASPCVPRVGENIVVNRDGTPYSYKVEEISYWISEGNNHVFPVVMGSVVVNDEMTEVLQN